MSTGDRKQRGERRREAQKELLDRMANVVAAGGKATCAKLEEAIDRAAACGVPRAQIALAKEALVSRREHMVSEQIGLIQRKWREDRAERRERPEAAQ